MSTPAITQPGRTTEPLTLRALRRVPALRGWERALLWFVLSLCVALGLLGLASSFWNLEAKAAEWGWAFPWMLPVGMDLAIPAATFGHLLLIRLDMAMPALGMAARALAATTVYLNWTAEHTLGGRLSHALLVLVWVGFAEVAGHVYGVMIGEITGKRIDGIRKIRWVLSPAETFGMWRRMRLWELTSYDEVRQLRVKQRLQRARFRDQYGRFWRHKISREQLVMMRLGDRGVLSVASVTTTIATASTPILAPANTAHQNTDDTELAPAPTSAKNVLTCDLSQDLTTAADAEATVQHTVTTTNPAVAGDSTTSLEDPSWRQETLVASDSSDGDSGDSDDEGAGDSSDPRVAPAPRQGGRHAASKRTRRPMEEWVELTTPLYRQMFHDLRQQPTGEQFAAAITEAGHGKVSASTAKNIRSAILDHEPLPQLQG